MRINDHIHSDDYPASYYAATRNDKAGFSQLISDETFDVCVIGGVFSGVAPTHMSAKLISEVIAGQAERYDILASINHLPFPGGRHLMQPAYAIGMAYYRLRDALGW